MGLDNGFIVKSNKRTITRDILPSIIVYPFDKDYSEGPEIVYWRKNWGLRNGVLDLFPYDPEAYDFFIDTPKQIEDIIAMIASFLDPVKWEEEGNSIWNANEIRPVLIQNIINLAAMIPFMQENPDIYLKFYDSY